jgi:uncharacterized protein
MSPESLFRRRSSILICVLIATVVLGSGIPNLSFTTDSRVFYDDDNPNVIDLIAFEEAFIPSHTVLFSISSKEPLGFSPSHRNAIDWVSEAVTKFPNVSRVDSLSTVSYPYDDSGVLTVDTYLEYICPKECIKNRLKTLNDPVVLNRLVSVDKKTSAVIGVFSIERGEAEKIGVVAQTVKSLKREFKEVFPDLELRASGGIPVSQAFVDASRKDSSTLFIGAVLIIVILLWLFLGDFRITAILLTTGLISVVVTMGAAGWMGVTLNSASSTVPIIVLTLVVASSMHLFTHYARFRQTEADSTAALYAALNANAIPIFLTAVTSSASLLSLQTISSPPVRDIGLLAGIGVFTGGILSITFAPLLLNTDRQPNPSRISNQVQQALNSYAKYLESGSQLSIWAGVAFFVAALGLTQMQIDDDFVSYLSKRTEVRNDTDFALQELSGPSHIELDISSRNGSVFDPKTLDQIDKLTAHIRHFDEVAVAISLSDLMKNVVRSFDDDRDLAQIDAESLAQYFFIFEMGLRAGESTSSIVNSEHTRTHISLLLRITSAYEIRKLETRLKELVRDFEQLQITVTGENIPVAHLSSSNIPAVASTVIVTLLITAILLGLYFKNYRVGINALIAITVPVACGLGIWGWASGSIGLAGTIVIAVSLGVVIDDAIHLIYQQVSALRNGLDEWESTAYSIHRVGTAISATTAVLVLGLAPLFFSDFKVNATFASCTGIILLSSLVFDLVALPKLLVWSSRIER